MYERLSQTAGANLGFRIGSKVGRTEIESIIEELEKAIEEYGTIRLLVHMDHWNGMELVALLEDVEFLLHHLKDIDALAIVGDNLWEKWALALSTPLLTGKSKYFETQELDSAWAWLQSV